MTTVVVITFWFAPLNHNNFFLQMHVLGVNNARQGGVTLFLASMCLFCVILVVLFRTGHLIVSWFMTAQGYMLDLLADVTSTVSSC